MKRSIYLLALLLSSQFVFGQVEIENVKEISKLTEILNDDITSDGMFGGSICHIGDLNGDGYQDIAVGSTGYDNRNGGVYILFLDDNFEVLDYTIIANGQGGLPSGSLGISFFSTNNMFGGSVESLGDLDGDGITDIAVSANEGLEAEYWYDQGIGSVWILFLNNDGSVKDFSWLHSRSEAWPVTLPMSLHLDYDLNCMGDLDDDGVTELALGAISHPNIYGADTIHAGGVYILYLNNDGTVKSHGVVDGVAQQHDDFFGCSVDILGDINQDGVQDYIVGSYGYDGSSNLEGAAYVLFMADDTTFSSYTRIAENENGFDEDIGLMDVYSKSLTATGDIDGDCIPDFIVGEPWNDDIATKMGAFFAHCLNADGSLKSYQKFDGNTPELSPFLQEGDRFGFVEYMGDLNNDGYPELAVGAYNDDANMASDYDSGAIYLISLNGVVPCESSITSDYKKLPISIYPNPASGYLWLTSESGNIESYVIVNHLGRVQMAETNLHSSRSNINISSLSDGVYYIQVLSENTIVTTIQFVKLPE